MDTTRQNKALKVLLLTQNFPPETVGGATHNFEMAKYLSKFGCNVDVVTTYPTYPYGEFEKPHKFYLDEKINGVTVKRIWAYIPRKSAPPTIHRLLQYGSFSLHAFVKIISHKEYDAIITSQPPEFTLVTGYFLKKITRKPWIVDVRDLWLENATLLGFLKKNSIFYKMFEKFRKIALSSVDVFAYTAPTIKNWFFENYDIQGVPLFNPNGVDPTEYPYRKDVGKNLIYVGNIGYAYDLKTVIEALLYLRDKSIKLLIRGGGDKKQAVANFILDLELSDRVSFIEKLPRRQLLTLISNSRIGLCPLRKEDSLKSVIPTKVIEYMGCGIPFIGTGEGEIARLAMESSAGVMVDNNPLDIAKAIEKLNNDIHLCKKMGENGRVYVEKEYNKLKIIEQLYITLKRVCKKY